MRKHLIPINPGCYEYIDVLKDIFNHNPASCFNEQLIIDNYTESMYQIFSCLDYDLKLFKSNLNIYPIVNKFRDHQVFLDASNGIHKYLMLKESFHNLAIQLYFKLINDYKILKSNTSLILLKVYYDFVLILDEEQIPW